MDGKVLDDLLKTVVRHYGFSKVDRALHRLERAEGTSGHTSKPRASSSGGRQSAQSGPKGEQRMTAPLYVDKLKPGPGRQDTLRRLANMFDEKTFLATAREIRDFGVLHKIDLPVSSSRAASIPRIFRALSAMSAAELEEVVRSAQCSGPSNLAPIADAIRRCSRTTKAKPPLPGKDANAPSGNGRGMLARPEDLPERKGM